MSIKLKVRYLLLALIVGVLLSNCTKAYIPKDTESNLSPAINGTAHSVTSTSTNTSIGPTIAVHCVAGLGRAPVLVAIALIEFAKMDPVTAADFIRKHRRGAINNTQLDWLERYKRRYKGGNAGGGCCVVM